jgi:hypothetical protein
MVGRPTRLAEQLSGNDASDVLHENLEQHKLATGEIDGRAPVVHGSSGQIELDPSMFQHRFLDRRLTSQKRAKASEQLFQTEGLRQVIVGAKVQPFDAVLDGIPGAQNQYGFIEGRLTPLFEQFKAIAIGQSQIQNDRVVSRFA